MSYRSLGSDEVTLRNYPPVGRRKGNMSLSDPLAAGVVVDLHKPGLSGIRIRLPSRRLIFARRRPRKGAFGPHSGHRAPLGTARPTVFAHNTAHTPSPGSRGFGQVARGGPDAGRSQSS